jgi:hypothetical protein
VSVNMSEFSRPTTGDAFAFFPWLSDEAMSDLVRIQTTNAAPRPRVLSAVQYATLEALVETIIPAERRWAGAKQARVADYIDLLLVESDDATRLLWFCGLAELDEESIAGYGQRFAALGAFPRRAIVAEIDPGEGEARTTLEAFFAIAKQASIHGYLSSEIDLYLEE